MADMRHPDECYQSGRSGLAGKGAPVAVLHNIPQVVHGPLHTLAYFTYYICNERKISMQLHNIITQKYCN